MELCSNEAPLILHTKFDIRNLLFYIKNLTCLLCSVIFDRKIVPPIVLEVFYRYGVLITMKLSEIVDVLDAVVLTKQNDLNKEYIKVGGSDLMSDILAGLSEGGV